MENLIVPEIVPLYFNSEKVLTINQLAQLFNSKGSTIRVAFSRHRKNFIENVDYFYLNFEQLAEFKAANRQCTNVIYNSYAPFSTLASSLYLWTKNGVEKLAKFIGTDEAKFIYSAVKQMYFTKVTPLPKLETFDNLAKVDRLIKIAELTEDKIFKENLLQRAAELI